MKRWTGPLLLTAGLVGAGWLLRSAGLGDAVARAGERGPLVFLALAAVACTVGVPRQVVAYAGGLSFGFWPGAALALLAELVGCAADFWWSRAVGRRWAAGFLARRGGRLARWERFLASYPFRATLTIRLLPVGNNVATNLVAGITGVALLPFLAASALGYVPQTAVFALLGGGVRVSAWAQLALAAVLLAGSIGVGVWLMRTARPWLGSGPETAVGQSCSTGT